MGYLFSLWSVLSPHHQFIEKNKKPQIFRLEAFNNERL
jgi:hypothetical protein